MHISKLLQRNAQIRGNSAAYIVPDVIWTWAQVHDRVNRLANALIKMGVTPGDRVAMIGPSGVEDIEVWYACARIGAVRVGINPRLTAPEIADILSVASPKAVISGTAHVVDVEEALSATNGHGVEFIVGCGDGHGLELDYASMIRTSDSAEPDRPLVETAPVAITFTSGSTGRPKGVVFTNDRIIAHMYGSALAIGLRQDDVWLQNMPTFGAPIVIATWNLLHGNRTVIMPRFDVEMQMQLIERYGVTAFANSATTIARFIDHPDFDRYELGSIRTIMYGQGPTSASLLRRAHAKLPTGYFQAYGTTEGTLGFFSALTQVDHARCFADPALDHVLESAGRPMTHVNVDIVTEDGALCAPGEQGEIRIQGDIVSPGYWQDPQNTAEFFRNDGLYTGDIGYLDDDGFLHLVDRKGFMLMSGGFKVASAEIEKVIEQLPSVEQVCVIGVPDVRWGEAIVAVVVPRVGLDNVSPTFRDEITAHCRSRLAGYKVPKSIEFLAELPHSPQGKLLKKDVRAMFSNSQSLTGVL